MHKYYLALPCKQDRLSEGRIKTAEDYYLNPSRCAIDHHPSLPSRMKSSYYPFSSEQDRLKDGLIRLDLGPIRHYLSIGHLNQIIGPRFLISLDVRILRTSF